jgi:putative chitinase
MDLTPAILQRCMPRATPAACAAWAPAFDAAAKEFGIDGLALACWLASMANESGQLSEFRELWRYSPERAAEIYGLSADDTARYQQSREVWFEFVYGYQTGRGRMLGNDQPGDGGKFYGRGPIQLTGKGNFRHVGEGIGVDLVAHPEKMLEPATGARAAAYYFTSNNIDDMAADGTEAGFLRAVRAMNSGLGDFSPHLARWHEVRAGLGLEIDLAAVQRALNAMVGPPQVLAEDGIMGPRTRSAITAYQSAHGLPVTGAPDAATLAALGLRAAA